MGVVTIGVVGCDRKPIHPGGAAGAGDLGTGGGVAPSGGGGAVGVVAGAGGGEVVVGTGGSGGVVVGTGGVVGSGGVAGTGDGGGAAPAGGGGGGEGGNAAGSSGGGGGEGGGAAGSSAGGSGGGGVSSSCPACADGLVCVRSTPAVCADPQWAAWPMPNGKVDVASGAPNEMSFTDNGDGTVTDNVTRLMWQQILRAETYEWSVAGAFCRDLELAGYDDWRLPSQIELTSIADLGRANPAIDTTVFPDTPSNYFWTSSIVGSSPTDAASVTFARGNTKQQMMGTSLLVRCVR